MAESHFTPVALPSFMSIVAAALGENQAPQIARGGGRGNRRASRSNSADNEEVEQDAEIGLTAPCPIGRIKMIDLIKEFEDDAVVRYRTGHLLSEHNVMQDGDETQEWFVRYGDVFEALIDPPGEREPRWALGLYRQPDVRLMNARREVHLKQQAYYEARAVHDQRAVQGVFYGPWAPKMREAMEAKQATTARQTRKAQEEARRALKEYRRAQERLADTLGRPDTNVQGYCVVAPPPETIISSGDYVFVMGE